MKKGIFTFFLIMCCVFAACDSILLTRYMTLPKEATDFGGRGMYADGGEDPTEPEPTQVTEEDPGILPSAWSTPEGNYYFTEDGGYYFISEQTENYIKGSMSVRKLESGELTGDALKVAGIFTSPRYYAAEVVVEEELYFGSRRTGNSYTLYIAVQGDDAVIFDSGWGDATQASADVSPGITVLEDHFNITETASLDRFDDTPAWYLNTERFEDKTGRESWNVADAGDCLLVRIGDDLYTVDKDMTETPRPVFLSTEEEKLTVFGWDGSRAVVGVGEETENGYATKKLYSLELLTLETELITEGPAKDFLCADGMVFYTDYNNLVRVMDGKSEVIWDYTVYCFEYDEGKLFIYDGESWGLIDAVTGEDYGYICQGSNYSYESDVPAYAEDFLYYVAYDYCYEELSLRALNIWSGDEYVIGTAYAGSRYDTYNCVFYDSYVLYTADDRETLVRVDLRDGSVEEMPIDDDYYWYMSELILVDGAPMACVKDHDEERHYVRINYDLSFTELELPALYEEVTEVVDQ